MPGILCSSLINGDTINSNAGGSYFSFRLLHTSDGCIVRHKCSDYRSVSQVKSLFNFVFQKKNYFSGVLLVQCLRHFAYFGVHYQHQNFL